MRHWHLDLIEVLKLFFTSQKPKEFLFQEYIPFTSSIYISVMSIEMQNVTARLHTSLRVEKGLCHMIRRLGLYV